MVAIENFAALSEMEQREFAEALVKTINSESIFSSEINFEITNVKAYEFDGSLAIEVSQTETIDVPREAAWQAGDEEEAALDPGYEAEYTNSIYDDVKKAFKTAETVIDGYKVSLDISDVEEVETVEVEVDNISHEDSGIGSYEYWGHTGYDSNPYVEVEGSIIKACDCSLAFIVEPVDVADEKPTEEPTSEEN